MGDSLGRFLIFRVAAQPTLYVVPAQAGTHNHR
jgi:hypothetical protein